MSTTTKIINIIETTNSGYNHMKKWLLTFKSYYNIAPTYLCELISRRESYVNTRLGVDHHQLIMLPISKDCSNTFLERSFIYAAPCEWNKLSECIRTSNCDSFRKSVKTMLFTQQYGYWVKIVDILLLFRRVWVHVVNRRVFSRSNKYTFWEWIHDSTNFIFGICYMELVMDSI